jgi:TolB protein
VVSAATAQNVSSTITETQITTDKSDQYGPDIYGDRIVWADHRNGNYDIYVYNISTSTETQITTNEVDQRYPDIYGDSHPSIYGDRIVWENEHDLRNLDIYMYNLSANKETKITTSRLATNPAIYGDRIVWEDYRNGNEHDWDPNWNWNNPDIYMYDLSTSKETQITTDKSDQYDPDIYGDRIVWADHRNGNYDIYMYNISTSIETQTHLSKIVKKRYQ